MPITTMVGLVRFSHQPKHNASIATSSAYVMKCLNVTCIVTWLSLFLQNTDSNLD